MIKRKKGRGQHEFEPQLSAAGMLEPAGTTNTRALIRILGLTTVPPRGHMEETLDI